MLYSSDDGFFGSSTHIVERTVVVEKKSFMSTGTVAYVEGDIIEIELPQATYYRPGDPVKLVIYSSTGMITLQSSVLAVEQGVLVTLNPPEYQKQLQKRGHPRLEIATAGAIETMREAHQSNPIVFPEPVPFRVENISLGGVGFVIEQPIVLRERTVLDVELEISGLLKGCLSIQHSKKAENGTYYGAMFVNLPDSSKISLRGYILRKQIERRSRTRTVRSANSAESQS